eukprot:gnl/Spiro4/10113_TR5368_c0_g1_i1.p1 gnl/Spiro4/10113_TR5368_c0_g1~~gnl/Spiro4/10113_TR5368_c0_g1_i1.p1  ORF type:complete len:584 (-),score=170.52 gnl/Spiro4/10113_TR5368_c0_g1_i1:89-1783(-)
MSSWALEGDGPVESLYHLLWRKNGKIESCPGVRVPDTVIYKYRQPAYWYFTSNQDGQLKKKSRGNQGNNKIIEGFGKNKTCDIVAYYISTHHHKAQGKKEEKTTTIEYFDSKGLHDFLHNRDKIDNGFLQAFIPPKGSNHSIIRATWSPKVFLLERRVNNYNLNDRKFDMYERAATYEGTEDQSQLAPVTAEKLIQDLQFICNSIVQHIAVTSPHHWRISRMVCNFKLDAHERVWFLWCSSLRLYDKFAGRSNPMPLELNEQLVPAKMWNPSCIQGQVPPVSKANFFKCPNCQQTVAHNCKCTITYKLAVIHYNRQKAAEICLVRTPPAAVADSTTPDINDPLAVPAQNSPGDDHSSDDKEDAFGEQGPKLEVYYPELARQRQANAVVEVNQDEDDGDAEHDPVTIPPVIQFHHKKLRPGQFRRQIQDPQFLFTTTNVCEDCCMMMNASSLAALSKEKFSDMQEPPKHGATEAVAPACAASLPRPPPPDPPMAVSSGTFTEATLDRLYNQNQRVLAAQQKAQAETKARESRRKEDFEKKPTFQPNSSTFGTGKSPYAVSLRSSR